MSTIVCPNGHISTETDYCSDCGAKIQTASELLTEIRSSEPNPWPPLNGAAATTAPPAVKPALTAPIACPACGAEHKAEDGNFCEICGYNFATGTPADLPIVTLTPPPIVPPLDPISGAPLTADPISGEPIAPVASPAVTSTTGWSVTIVIDPSLGTADSPPAPNQAPIVVPLNQSTSLIGRTSVARGVTPEIPLDFDDAISHRHALLIVQPDGSLVLRDIGSSNGVQYKGQDLTVMADVPIPSGETFSLGHWTTITVMKQ